MTDEYDLIVLGGGPVGENVADRAVQSGLTAVIVESELVGGECSYWACMPSKALLRSPQALRAARHVGGAAEAITGDLDVRAVLDRRDSFTSHWKDDGQVAWLDSAGIDLVRGHPRPTAACAPSPRGTRSRSAPDPTPRSPRSPVCTRRTRGRAARPRAPRRSRTPSSSSAAAWSRSRWRPRTPRSVRRSRSSPAAGCSDPSSRSRASSSPRACVRSASTCARASRRRASLAMPTG
jgi:hypothetical protein